MTSGSRPAVHPSANFGSGGRSASFPFGAPPSTHAAMVSICACDRLRSFRIFSVCAGSANHGGISRDDTLFLITFAHGRTSSYEVSVIGATSPLRWQLTHLSKTIGATSFVNVGVVAAGAGAACTLAIAAREPRSRTNARFMRPPQNAECGTRNTESRMPTRAPAYRRADDFSLFSRRHAGRGDHRHRGDV